MAWMSNEADHSPRLPTRLSGRLLLTLVRGHAAVRIHPFLPCGARIRITRGGRLDRAGDRQDYCHVLEPQADAVEWKVSPQAARQLREVGVVNFRPSSEVHRIGAARFAAGFRLAYRRSELDGIAALPVTHAVRGHSGRWRERVRSSMNRNTSLGPPDRHRITRVPRRAPGSGAPSE